MKRLRKNKKADSSIIRIVVFAIPILLIALFLIWLIGSNIGQKFQKEGIGGVWKNIQDNLKKIPAALSMLGTPGVGGGTAETTAQVTLCTEADLQKCKGSEVLVDGIPYKLTFWQNNLYLYQTAPSAGRLIPKGDNSFCAREPAVCIKLEFSPTPSKITVNADIYKVDPELIDSPYCCVTAGITAPCISTISCDTIKFAKFSDNPSGVISCITEKASKCGQLPKYCCYGGDPRAFCLSSTPCTNRPGMWSEAGLNSCDSNIVCSS